MLRLSEITKQYLDRIVLDEISLHIGEGERIALVGANGAGKSTLLRIIVGSIPPDAGEIVKKRGVRVGYLPQKETEVPEGTVWDVCLSARQDLVTLKDRLADLETELEQAGRAGQMGEILAEYDEAWHVFKLEQGPTLESDASRILTGLGFKEEDFDRRSRDLSGGWKMRLSLARLLLLRPDLLLLDEPTNHLDLETRNWLAAYLKACRQAFILISHDRYFLDATTERTIELEFGKAASHPGNYSTFQKHKETKRRLLEKSHARQQEEIGKLKDFIRRFHGQPTKASQVRDRVKKLQRIEEIKIPPARKRITFAFPQAGRGPRILVALERATKRYGDLEVFKNIDFVLERGDRIAVVGANGAGKSTLMRILAGREGLASGTRSCTEGVECGYFSQEVLKTLDPRLSVLDELTTVAPSEYIPRLRSMLGGFLFHGDDVFKKVEVLSGGEMTRLAIAKMLLTPTHLLVLDEPTNNLDMESIDVLLSALQQYKGSIVFVSHDRFFINALAGKVAGFVDGELVFWPGNYDAYLERLESLDSREPAPADTGSTGEGGREPGRGDWKQRKQVKAGIKALEKRIQKKAERLQKLEAQIEALEAELKSQETTVQEASASQERDRLRDAAVTYQRIKTDIEDLYWQWDEITTSLERARAEVERRKESDLG